MRMPCRNLDERLCPFSRFCQLSPEERLRIAADCLCRLRDVGPDPMTKLRGGHPAEIYRPIFQRRTGSGLRPPLAASFSRLSKPFIRVEVPTFFPYFILVSH
jgi:hypothetical protein